MIPLQNFAVKKSVNLRRTIKDTVKKATAIAKDLYEQASTVADAEKCHIIIKDVDLAASSLKSAVAQLCSEARFSPTGTIKGAT